MSLLCMIGVDQNEHIAVSYHSVQRVIESLTLLSICKRILARYVHMSIDVQCHWLLSDTVAKLITTRNLENST